MDQIKRWVWTLFKQWISKIFKQSPINIWNNSVHIMFIVQKILEDFRDGLHAASGICCIILFGIFVYKAKFSVNLWSYTVSPLLHNDNQVLRLYGFIIYVIFVLIPFCTLLAQAIFSWKYQVCFYCCFIHFIYVHLWRLTRIC